MILSAHQYAYLPWLGFFHKIAICDKFVVLDDVQFEKNSFTNRNQIKSPNGPIWLTVPVLLAGHTDSTIKDIKIDNTTDWRDKHWKGLLFNYKKAPYFEKYSGYFEEMYKQDWESLAKLLDDQFLFFLEAFGIKTEILYQSNLNANAKKQELIVDLCQKTGADAFVFGTIGQEYAEKDFFDQNKIKIYFQDYQHPVYNQLWKDFMPFMSAIDLLFNVGGEKALEVIMSGNIGKNDLVKMLKEQK